MKKIYLIGAIGALAAVTAGAPAFAGTATGSMLVQATVLESCTVVATPMLFGALTEVGSANVDSTATLTLACTPNADFDIAMNDGTNASSGQRRLKHSANAEFLNYNLYIDSGRSQPWGNTAGTNTKLGTAPLGTSIHTVYGQIPAGVAGVSAGSYADTVTVTVTF
jgi:spore coat protein U-like protein